MYPYIESLLHPRFRGRQILVFDDEEDGCVSFLGDREASRRLDAGQVPIARHILVSTDTVDSLTAFFENCRPSMRV